MANLPCLLESGIKTKEKEMVCSSSEQKSAVENISFQTSMVLVCCLLTRDPYRQFSSHQFPNLVITPR